MARDAGSDDGLPDPTLMRMDMRGVAGWKFPDSSKFAGPYVITWDGTGTLTMNAATWTETNNTGTTYTRSANGIWSNVAGKSALHHCRVICQAGREHQI